METALLTAYTNCLEALVMATNTKYVNTIHYTK